MNKAALSERDICTKYITPALERAGWNRMTQFREEVSFTDGRIYVRGKMTVRGKAKRADYVLYHKLGIPLAVIEAKDNSHSVRAGIQQALDYATTLDVPFVFSSNGDGFLFHDKTARDEAIETELTLDQFPSPELLWAKYTAYKQLAAPQAAVAGQAYYTDGSGRQPRYYQQIAINRCVEAIAKGQNRLMLVMATGTGKTYTAFQIIHRLWKAGVKKRILFLADRNSLIDQTARNDFKPFRDKMTTIRNREVDKSYQVYLALYQGLSSNEADKNVYRQFSPDFFDLIVVDECHRGSASEDSAWREILTYFGKATHLGLTATPKETHEISSSEYFGAPVYTYSLKQGIDDGFLAPYRVVRVTLNVDAEGWRPTKDKLDKAGNPVEDRVYNRKDYDRTLVIDERTAVVAAKLTEYLKQFDRFAKTIVFCTDIDHAERMRSELARLNADLVAQNHKYVMQITGDNDEGKRELDNFISVEERYPVIAVTSELMTTGVDAQTCKVIVLDANISSMTKFKQIIGRGTRIREDYGKLYFTILDFRNATDLFADPTFDGEPEATVVVSEDDDDFIIDGGDWMPETPENPDFPEADPKPPGYPFTPEDKPIVSEPRKKVYVNGVDVSVLLSRELHFNQEGKPVTISLVDYSREILQGQFASLDGFLTRWNTAARKHALIEELKAQGVLVDELREAVADRDLDLFDLLCYVAWGQPPLTRAERANNVKKRDVFAKYGEQARKVMYTLLEKYADEGLENIESMDVLKVRPLTQFGSPVEIIQHFGGKDQYLQALAELENALYQVA